MPEVAEIALNVDIYLKEYLLNKRLKDVEILSGKYKKTKKPINYLRFRKSLPSKVTSVNHRGKFIWITLANDWVIAMGFGMSGRYTLNSEMTHNRIVMMVADHDIFYNDTRNFGNWYFWDDPELLEKKLNSLGPCILQTNNLSQSEVVPLFRRKDQWEITKAIMSQQLVSGAGNWIKAEALYQSKICPYAKVGDLTDQELYQLYLSLVFWAEKGYVMQRNTIISGGAYQDFQEFMMIYNKSFDPDGNEIIKSTDTKDNRTTHWVPEVQKIGC